MKSVKELVTELCPDGVRYVTLKEVATIGTGSSNRNESTSEGVYPFYVRSKDVRRIDTYEFDETAIVIPGEGGVGEIFHFVEGKYALHQRAYRISFRDDRILPKFAYYYLKVDFKVFIKAKAVDGTVTSIRKPMIEDFRIPVPPLPVQQEIVRILDKFTRLEEEIEAELIARKSQLEHYRKQLLTFKESE
jgi:type I restriction enzyme S subunit